MGFFDKKDKKIRILSIDDSRLIQRTLQFEINQLGYDMLLATDGEEGVKLAEKEQPDLILLDNQMPGVSGLETCILLKKNGKTANIPIVMCTGESKMDTVEKALAVGAVGYLTKPVDAQRLKVKIAQVLHLEGAEAEKTVSNQGQQPAPAAQAAAPVAATIPPPPSVQVSAPPPPVTPYFCPTCKKHLVYIPQYKQYYCFPCNSYPSPQPVPPTVSKTCPTCSGELAYMHEQGQWYCFACKK